jgi:amino acid transporter
VLLAACLVLPFAANLLVLVLLGFYSPLNLSFRGTYDSLRTATVLLMSFAKSLVAVYMILTGIRLFLNRNDANAACRVKESTGLALKFYLFCVVLFVIACVINVLVLAYWLSPMLVSFFTPLGLPILHAYAKQLDRIIRGEKKPGFVWYLTAIITVLLSLAGVGILFVGALIK